MRSCAFHIEDPAIVAAYFGYNTAAGLRAEHEYPLTALSQAEILIPDLQTMDKRVLQLNALPAGFSAHGKNYVAA
jgi:hypothetical protein